MSWDENRPIVIGLGELLWDVFPDGKKPGGAPANVAFQAQQLGCQGVVASRVGEDDLGQELIDFLQSKGLRTLAVQRDPDFPTGQVTVSFNAQHQPEYVIHENVAWDQLEFNESLQQVMQKADAVCFGTLAQRSPVSRQTIRTAVQSTPDSCLRVYDVNIRQNYYDVTWIKSSLEIATIVKLNDEEVEFLAPQLDLPSDFQQFSRSLIDAYNVDLVCVTRGANGCLVVGRNEVVDVPGKPIKVADTVGAGDAFTAGLIFAKLRQLSLAQSGEFANEVGGLVASEHGAMPDLMNAYSELIAGLK